MKNKGFTVLELIVTLTIVTILLTVAVPSFNAMLLDKKLIGAAEKMKADMDWARTTAIKNNTNIIMNTSIASPNWCYGFSDGAACDCTVANNCTVEGITRQYNQALLGGTLPSPTLSPNGAFNITFLPRGMLAASVAGVLTMTLNGRTADISVSRLGRGNICSNNLGQFNNC